MNKLIKIRQYMILTSLIGLFAISCAPHPTNIITIPASQASYMINYYTCDILQLELADAESEITNLTGIQQKSYKKDRIIVGTTSFFGFFFTSLALLGLIALSDVKGTNKEYELGIAKGKVKTIKKVMAIKDCQ